MTAVTANWISTIAQAAPQTKYVSTLNIYCPVIWLQSKIKRGCINFDTPSLRYDFWHLIGDIILITDIVNSAPPSITVVVSLLYKPIIMASADITTSKMFCVLLPVNAFKMFCVLLFKHPQIQKTINIRVKADSMYTRLSCWIWVITKHSIITILIAQGKK